MYVCSALFSKEKFTSLWQSCRRGIITDLQLLTCLCCKHHNIWADLLLLSYSCSWMDLCTCKRLYALVSVGRSQSMLVLITDNQKCCLNLCADSVCLYFTKEVFLLAIMALPTQNYYLYYFNVLFFPLMCSFVKVKWEYQPCKCECVWSRTSG